MQQAQSNYRELYEKLVSLYRRSQRLTTNAALEREIERVESLVPPKIKDAALLDAYCNSVEQGKLLDFEYNNRIDGMDREQILELVYSRKEIPEQPFQHFFAPRKENVRLFIVRGDSMKPTLNDGEQVSVFQTSQIFEDKISLVELPEGKFLKRIKIEDDGYLLLSDNKTHKPMHVERGRLRVLGVVTHKIGEV